MDEMLQISCEELREMVEINPEELEVIMEMMVEAEEDLCNDDI